MEILFKQRSNSPAAVVPLFAELGIEECLCKHICFEKDRAYVTRKRHYHTFVEIHIIVRGYQIYEIDGAAVRVDAGQFLLIPPQVKHVTSEEDPRTEKYAFSFSVSECAGLAGCMSGLQDCVTGETPDVVRESLQVIEAERSQKSAYGSDVIGCRVWEGLLQILRAAGIRFAAVSSACVLYRENERLLLAKQYIEDNIYRSISVTELAYYCCLSEKQIARIFRQEEKMTVMEYIRKKRCAQIEKMLADPGMTLRAISEAMHFSSEYHFNAYFKKYAGMTPGAYRKSIL